MNTEAPWTEAENLRNRRVCQQFERAISALSGLTPEVDFAVRPHSANFVAVFRRHHGCTLICHGMQESSSPEEYVGPILERAGWKLGPSEDEDEEDCLSGWGCDIEDCRLEPCHCDCHSAGGANDLSRDNTYRDLMEKFGPSEEQKK